MAKIAVTHPGKLGDCLYSLACVRYLCKRHGKKADFWTSDYCEPLKRFMEYQSCIASFNISPTYEIDHMGMGVQPWKVPVPNESEYEAVYHLGFKSVPTKNIPDFICRSQKIPKQPIFYEYPDIPTLETNYTVVAPRGEKYWIDVMKDINEFPIVQIGAKGDYVGNIGIDKTGLDFLETTTWIAKSKVFMGCTSSQLVLAEGFPISLYIKPPFQNNIICKNMVI